MFQDYLDKADNAFRPINEYPLAHVWPDGKTKVMNQTMLNAIGYTTEETIGTDYLTTFIPEKEHKMLSEIFGRRLIGVKSARLHFHTLT